MQSIKTKVSFFLQDKERMNKDETKNQYINTSGATSWAETEKGLKLLVSLGVEDKEAWLVEYNFHDILEFIKLE